MDIANPFAQAPLTPDPIIAQVRRQVLAEAGDGRQSDEALVDGLVDRVVRDLWESRVKTFVPVLALRETRELLRVELLAAPPPLEASLATGGLTREQEKSAPGAAPDRLASPRDALAHERRDALHADGDILRV
jgi:hypothetical protein